MSVNKGTQKVVKGWAMAIAKGVGCSFGSGESRALGDRGVVWVRQMKWEGTWVVGQGIGEGRTKVRAGGPVSKREGAIGMDEGKDMYVWIR